MSILSSAKFIALTLCKLLTSASSEDPDEIPHSKTFHQGLHYLLRHSQSSEKEIQFLFGNYNPCPKYIKGCLRDHPKFFASNQHKKHQECSGSVVECWTRDQGASGSSLTSVTALCP